MAMTANEIARIAWRLSEDILDTLLQGAGDPSDRAEVRAQFARWAIHTNTPHPSWQAAWDAFVTRDPSAPRPMVMLMSVPCSACTPNRWRLNGPQLAGRPGCPECRGTGKRRAHALPAVLASETAGQHTTAI